MSFFQYQNGTLLAEQAPLAELAQRFGTPLYVYSRAALEKNYHAFDEAFAAVPHQVCYATVLCCHLLAGEKHFDDIVLHTPEWYINQGIELISGQLVVDVNRRHRQVITDQGLSIPYDRLLFATGSVPFIIPIPNHNHACVLSFRDIQDVEAMLTATTEKKKVAVIGGGLLGLEAQMAY